MNKDEKELVFSALYMLMHKALWGDVAYESRAREVLDKLAKKLPPDKNDYGNW